MPDSLVSEVVENPKNLYVTFKATDTESEGEVSREYELNFADSYIEQIQTELFSNSQMVISEAELENLNVENGVIDIEFNSNYEIGTQQFNNQLGNFSGLYSGNVELTRIPYEVDLTVNDSNGEAYQKQIEGERAKSFLNGEITEREFSDNLYINQLWTE
jgi:hypothetical protein